MGYQIHQRPTEEQLFNFWQSTEILIDLNDYIIYLFDLILGTLFAQYKAPVNAFLVLDVEWLEAKTTLCMSSVIKMCINVK
jgi:hypothetical protein